MRTVLSLFLVLLFVTSCGPDGGDIARDFVRGLQDALDEYGEEEVIEPDVFSDDGEEIDCSDPALTIVEPLPSGTYPSTVGSTFYYWECATFDIAYFPPVSSNSHGTFIGEFYNDAFQDVWQACGVGRQPPSFAGHWVVTENNEFCYRYNALPGAILCYPIENFPSGGTTLEIIHQGEVVGTHFFDYDCQREILP